MQICLIFFEEVIIYSNKVEEHIKNVDEIRIFRSAFGVILKIKKWHFFPSTFEYLGHVINPGEAEADWTKP